MRTKIPLVALFLTLVCGVSAQRANQPPQDPMTAIANEMAVISQGVQAMNERLKLVIDKVDTGSTEKRQKIVAGLQALAAAEQRVIVLQNSQFDLTSKLNDTRSKLTQVEVDLRPRSIDRSVQFEGTTETDELREARRQRLTGDRLALSRLMQDLQTQLTETMENLRDAQNFAKNLRKTYVPMMEKELADQER